MPYEKISGHDLNRLGIYEPDLIRKFGRTAKKLIREGRYSKQDILAIFAELTGNPLHFISRNDEFSALASVFQLTDQKPAAITSRPENEPEGLSKHPIHYKIYGKDQVEPETLDQMNIAMRLPVVKAGALMPDAHVGYGLPIGGVMATRNNVVIPYAVGVDIACRMCMSVYDFPVRRFAEYKKQLIEILTGSTVFGIGGETKEHLDTQLFDSNAWSETRVIRELRDLAYRQHGTSGAGNHFVEWGMLSVPSFDPMLKMPPGEYLALLSHSGSRRFGAEIARIYSEIAKQKLNLPAEARHLSWLDLDSEEGHEYWIAMNLAGEYASDNHREIHQKIEKRFGFQKLTTIENHHNFAWKESLEDETDVIVHRKGATPAGKNNIGIIPGSMTQHGFIVRGKADPESLNSASHGAGRKLSRSKAIKTISQTDLKILTEKAGIELIGGDVDEAPTVYKNIDQVMGFQKNLIEILAVFSPKIVRMAEPEKRRRKPALPLLI
jgi:tRNA-splicing ligase RtcB